MHPVSRGLPATARVRRQRRQCISGGGDLSENSDNIYLEDALKRVRMIRNRSEGMVNLGRRTDLHGEGTKQPPIEQVS